MRTKISINIISIIILLISLNFIGNTCKSILPDEFDEKSFDISEYDQNVCELLSQALYDTNTAGIVIDSNFVQVNLSSFKNIVDSATLTNYTHNQIIVNNFTQLLTNLEPLELQNLMVMQRDISVLPVDNVADTCYTKLSISSGTSGELIFFTSWNFLKCDTLYSDDLVGFTENNYQDYIELDIINSDSSYVSMLSGRSLESISGCVQPVPLSTGDALAWPVIRGRHIYNVAEGDYIVRSIISSTDIYAFKLLIMAAE